MSRLLHDELLPYYEGELTYLRQMGRAFAEKYPKIATRLQLDPDECADPHVERLIESFAFMAARLQRDIDAEFPQITQALLEILYPQLTRPIPSMSIVQFSIDPKEGKITTGHRIPRHTPLIAESMRGQVCRFRTGAPAEVWPIEVSYAGIEPPGRYDFLENRPEIAAVLRLSLVNQETGLGEMELDKLRFFLGGDRSLTARLYEVLFLNVGEIALVGDSQDQVEFLPKDSIRAVGFDEDEALLPYPGHAHQGYRLLQEFFAFPKKFHFFDLEGLRRRPPGSALDILFLVEEEPEGLTFDRDNFRLGCAPMINLFTQVSDPIRLDERRFEYRLLGDSRQKRATEIYAVDQVATSLNFDDETKILSPFFSFSHHGGEENASYWIARRRESFQNDMPGSEVMLSFLDLNYRGQLPPEKIVYAKTLCTNRNIAEELRSGSLLQIDSPSALAKARCLIKPTQAVKPRLGSRGMWQLISHLSLNYLSLSEGKQSLDALREILYLYCTPNDATDRKQVRGIRGMSTRRVTHRAGDDAWRGYCRGLEVTLDFDERMFVGTSAYLFASVIHRFLALHAAINSFTQLAITRKGRKGVWKKWEPIAGDQKLL